MMMDSGVMQRLFANEWSKELASVSNFEKCFKRHVTMLLITKMLQGKSDWTPVEISDILPLVTLLAGGIIVGGILLCSEFIFRKSMIKCKDKIPCNCAMNKSKTKKKEITVD